VGVMSCFESELLLQLQSRSGPRRGYTKGREDGVDEI
jgi:hypothetical protein